MWLQHTDKARYELRLQGHALRMTERSLLMRADGAQLAQLQQLFHGTGAQLIENLLHQGYLRLRPTSVSAEKHAAMDAASGQLHPAAKGFSSST